MNVLAARCMDKPCLPLVGNLLQKKMGFANATGSEQEDLIGNDPILIAQQLFARHNRDKHYVRIGTKIAIALRPARYATIA